MKTKTIKKQNSVKQLVSLLLLIIFCFSCNNEEISPVPSYSPMEQKEIIDLANKYNVKVYFKETSNKKKMSLGEIEKLLQDLNNLQCEFSIPYMFTYGTSTKTMIPQTRSTINKTETFNIAHFTINIEDGESVTATGLAHLTFIGRDPENKLISLSEQVSFHTHESDSQKGYRYSVSCDHAETIEPTYITSEDLKKFSGATIRTSLSIYATSKGLAFNSTKQCKISVPTKEGEEATCSIF